MKAYLALMFQSSHSGPVLLKRWLLREGTEVVPQQELFSFSTGGKDQVFPSPIAGTFKAFLWKEEETLHDGDMIAVLQVEEKAARDAVENGLGKILSPEEAKGGMSYAEAASIRLPPEAP